ncbi:MAG: T9SS type A sorting domain-containing protein [Bacteroidia bacterium]|nr:T9SS type A sorting domain-containing protein [Bacteroidia bacterium]
MVGLKGKFIRSTVALTIVALIHSGIGSAQFTFSSGTANTTNSGTKSVRLLNEVTTTAELSVYGGNLKSKGNATGYFQITKVNGCWYLIDPDGYLFFTVGVNSVSKGGGVQLPDFLRNIGTNTLGCWSDETINDGALHKMAYCPRWNFMLTYKNSTQRTKDMYTAGIIPVFDPAYITFCNNHAMQLSGTSTDPFLLGHFSDNELPIYDNTTYGNLLDRFLAIADKSDPNYLAAKSWIVGRRGESYTITSEDRELFHGYLLGNYYRITGEAIKRYDPNHLYLGSRLHGAAKDKPSIFIEAGKYVDMISINVYSVWTPSTTQMNMWSSGGKPFFVTEFYAKAQDAGLPNTEGAGWLVPTQSDRAKFFENFTLALIEHPGCVGYHHFRYIDDADANKGLINASYQWYEPLKNSFYKVARDIYGLREFMTGQSTGIKRERSSEVFSIYPNPTSGVINISFSTGIKPSDIEIFSLDGKIIQHLTKIEFPYTIEMPLSPPGIYIIRVLADNLLFTGSFLKNEESHLE